MKMTEDPFAAAAVMASRRGSIPGRGFLPVVCALIVSACLAAPSIVSSAPGKQGHETAARHNEMAATFGAAPAAILVDEPGIIGRAYEARTTPHMYVINPEGPSPAAAPSGTDDNDQMSRFSVQTRTIVPARLPFVPPAPGPVPIALACDTPPDMFMNTTSRKPYRPLSGDE
jgi:hypothetical protein